MNFQYPIFLDLAGKKCLVVGDHPEIPFKIQGLLAAGARVEHQPACDPADLADRFLVIAALPDNSEIFRLCEERNILCNSIDDPNNCRFAFGAVCRQRDLTIAISTNGAAPALAARLRQKLERQIGPEHGEFLALLKELRPEIAARVPDFAARRDLWYRIVDSDALDLLRKGDAVAAHASIRALIDRASSTSRSDTSARDADR
ncbi:MAG: bifunctional precorrin-2 dehydrogenase/sirohydrochlorin ferrochelatase [Acidobacteriaceae bacterium]|nr:bifunctional precorrin-2 dehydrogenase/sirohydrochlorin ferrochelatase [Acidobacteriaceae bacterium]